VTRNFFEPFDESLDSDEAGHVAQAREFAQQTLAPAATTAFNASEAFERSVISDWATLGMLGLQVDRAAGGKGASYLCKIRVAQELALAGFAAAFCLNNLQGIPTRLARHGSPRQVTELLAGLLKGELLTAPAMTEPQGGSDLAALASHVRRVPGGWLLNGTKAWITNGLIVDWLTLLARVPDGDRNDIASFLVCCHGDSVRRTEIPVPGGRSFRLAELEFRDHFVPDWAMLQAPGTAMKASLESINAARVHVAAMAVATQLAALRAALAYGGSRTAFGKALLEHQGMRWSLADVATRLEAAHALVHRAALAVERGGDVTVLAAQAKSFAVSSAIEGVQACMAAMGATGASAAHPLAMHVAEVRLATYADGSGEMLRDRVGRLLPAAYLDT